MIKKTLAAEGIRFSIAEQGREVAHAYLYIMHNDLHQQPFGLMEDVYVEEQHRAGGFGTQVLEALIAEAQERGCYKLIGTSRFERPRVHELYERLGFRKQGLEFRVDFDTTSEL